ncbi:MAG: hypothetical protein EZS28_025463 [Streblomastix strix]|uniref:Uncharacterized protein n=1 Tax=Streblomastix strix TaxID=222440 RepID=A0A5J4V922_9EUKA|nr:MAG: hypothetical protein EZS28_025463 [Streblomastix strix]
MQLKKLFLNLINKVAIIQLISSVAVFNVIATITQPNKYLFPPKFETWGIICLKKLVNTNTRTGAAPPLPLLGGLPPPKPPVWGSCPRPSLGGLSPPKPPTKGRFAPLDPLRGSPPTLDRLVLILISLALRPVNQGT